MSLLMHSHTHTTHCCTLFRLLSTHLWMSAKISKQTSSVRCPVEAVLSRPRSAAGASCLGTDGTQRSNWACSSTFSHFLMRSIVARQRRRSVDPAEIKKCAIFSHLPAYGGRPRSKMLFEWLHCCQTERESQRHVQHKCQVRHTLFWRIAHKLSGTSRGDADGVANWR